MLVIIALMACTGRDNGIYPHPSGQAVYLRGEACTVNATPDITPDQYKEMLFWCAAMRDSYH